MVTPKTTIWPISPHTRAKHEILKRYLQAWFPILGRYHTRIVYVDGFCGPGRYAGGEPGSPIIALEVALAHQKAIRNEIVFWFIDADVDRIRHLKSELATLTLPSHFKAEAEAGMFHEKLGWVLDCLDARGDELAPTFAFIDPFGFSGIPYALVQRLLKRRSCEVLITFMVDAINRWLEHPDEAVWRHIPDTFGTDECMRIAKQPGDRVLALRNLYQAQLRKAASFVRFFEMRNRAGRTECLLFFATNHRLGHVKMKEAMWRVDPEGAFRFSDATNPSQLILFEADPAEALWPVLLGRFEGQEVVTDEILAFVEEETAFLGTHMRAALKSHLDESLTPDERIQVRETKVGGAKWVRGTFPSGVSVRFPRK